jgi:ABC-type phosphate transport system substrate-binding protein
MRSNKYILIIIISILTGTISSAQTGFVDLTIIGNKTGFDKNAIKEIKQIFKGKYSTWPLSRSSVTIVLPAPQSPNAQKVATQLYANTVSGVQKYWLSLVFQGRANPPIFLETDEEIIAVVKKTPGAIGVVSSSNANIPKNLIISIVN